MKGRVDVASLCRVGLAFHGRIGGWPLALSHTGTGDAVAIPASPGTRDRLRGAKTHVAERHADLNKRDCKAYLAAIAAGRVSAPPSS